MTLSQAIVYYIFAFVLTLAFIVCGCFIGSTLRKKKNAKLAANTDVNNITTDDSDISDEK